MNLEDLGRRAVACKHFYFMPGMLLSNGRRVGVWTDGWVCGSSETSPPYDGIVWPDLTDPATLGCLLALVREAWPHEWHQFMVPIFDGISQWYMGCLMPGTSRIVMPTRVMQNGLLDALPPKPGEVEALVAALEAAP